MEVLHRDCLIPIATSLALSGSVRWDKPCASFSATDGENHVVETLNGGEIYRFSFPDAEQIAWQIEPRRGVDAGNGPGEPVSGTSVGSATGILVDTRGRPLILPQDTEQRCACIRKWLQSADAFSF